MVLRFLIRLLANNEQLVQRLSESYPVRRAAQLVVRGMFHGKNFIEEKGLNLDHKWNPQEFRDAMKKISISIKVQIKETSDNLKKKMQ